MSRIEATQLSILGILLLGLLAMGFVYYGAYSAREDRHPEARHSIMQDERTGCEYIVFHNGGVAPRIDTDGRSQRGCGKIKGGML